MNKNTVKTIAKLYEIEETKGTNAKKAVLEKYADDRAFTETLRWYFNNLIVTGIKAKKIEKNYHLSANDFHKAAIPADADDYRDWGLMDLFEYLGEHNTGRDADLLVVEQFAKQFDKKTETGILRLVTKTWDKGLGIGRTICNNVYGENFLPVHQVMLCKNYFDDTDYFVGKKFAIQVKLDGFRMTIFKKGEKITVLSRSGKDQTGNFPLIEKEVREVFKNHDVVLDGERMPLGFMEMDSDKQYKLVSESTKKGGSTEVCLAVYDFMFLKDWEQRHQRMTYGERYGEYSTMINNKKCKYLFALPALYIGDDISEIEKWLDWAHKNKKEGVIVKTLDGMYQWDRTIDCVKVKTFKDADLEIIDFQEGRGRHKGRLGAVVVNYKGNKVAVGSGFSDEMRDEIWKNKKKYLGKIAEIVYFEETENKAGGKSLRFPTFKTIKTGD